MDKLLLTGAEAFPFKTAFKCSLLLSFCGIRSALAACSTASLPFEVKSPGRQQDMMHRLCQLTASCKQSRARWHSAGGLQPATHGTGAAWAAVRQHRELGYLLPSMRASGEAAQRYGK